MKMIYRKRRIFLLTLAAILFVLSILDIRFREEEVFEQFSDQFFNEEKTIAYSSAQNEVRSTVQRQLEIKDVIKEVELSTVLGTISVEKSPDNILRLDYSITAAGKDQASADQLRDDVVVKTEMKNGKLLFVPLKGEEEIDYDSVSIDYKLYVPNSTKLTLKNENGRIEIHGIEGDITANSHRGMMSISNIQGNLVVNSTQGSAYLSAITGDVQLKSRSSSDVIDDVKGSLTIDSQSASSLKISQVTGMVTSRMENSWATFSGVNGPVKLSSRGSDVLLDEIQGDIDLSDQAGSITFILPKEEGYLVNARLDGGQLRASIPFEKETGENGQSYEKGVVGAGTWKVNVKAVSGEIFVHTK
jgi:hypothetical protein